MSEIVVETKAQATVKTIKLHNGQTFSYNSNVSIELEEIAVIDVSGMFSDRLVHRKVVAEKIREASQKIGFFYVINHVCP